MQLTCPSCSAQYRIAADRWPMQSGPNGLAEPKPSRARCKACDHIWLACPEYPEPIILLDEPLAPAVGGADDHEADPAEPTRRLWRWLTGAAAAMALAGWVSALSGHWRPQDLGLPPAAVPDVNTTLASIGLPLDTMHWPDVRLPRFALSDVRVPEAAPPPLSVNAEAVTRPIPGGGHVWEIRGQVTNPGSVSQPVPPLEVLLTTADGLEVSRWTVRADTERLPPGGTIAFATSAINPPANAHTLAVRLRPASVARL